MSDQIQREPRTWQYGLSLFAGIMMVTVGVFEALQGLVALFDNNVFLKTPNYIFAFDLTTWGWIHLLMGLLLIVIGFLVVAGKMVGRVLGIVVVGHLRDRELRQPAVLPALVDLRHRARRVRHLGVGDVPRRARDRLR